MDHQLESWIKTRSSHLDGLDLTIELSSLICRHASGNDGSRDSTSPTKGSLGGDKDVWDVLVFAEKWEMEDDLDRLDVGCHDDKLADPSIEGLCSLVGPVGMSTSLLILDMDESSVHSYRSPFLELLVVRSLLDQVEDLTNRSAFTTRKDDRDATNLVRELGVGQREGFGVRCGHGDRVTLRCWFY